MYYVYVLYSDSSGRFYKGMTDSLELRLKEHNAGKTKSTKAFTPWRIVYTEEFDTREEARDREKYLKTAAGRRWLKNYFDENNGPVVQGIE